MQSVERLSERKLSNKQLIIGKFVDTSAQVRGFWPREMKVCNKLVELYGEPFLLWANPPNFKAKSLTVYLGEWGKKFLAGQLFEFKKSVEAEKPLEKTEAPTGEKVGNDILIEKKPQTLKDFLNLFN